VEITGNEDKGSYSISIIWKNIPEWYKRHELLCNENLNFQAYKGEKKKFQKYKRNKFHL